jgi:engulfment/cell motility protein 1
MNPQYALTALSNLLDLPFGWSSLSPNFIHKIVQILASPNNLINVCRPATLILKKLVEADPSAGPGEWTFTAGVLLFIQLI